MKFILFIFLICNLVFLNRAAVMRGTYEDPNHPGKCVIDDTIMSPGDVIASPIPKCRRVICGENSMVVIHTCGTIGPPPGHKLGDRIEPTEPYPKCYHPGKCVIDDTIMSPGDVIASPIPKCRRVICGENSMVVIHTCGTIGPPPGHKLGDRIEPTEPYPKCCKRHFVPVENEN